eukprot:9152314-Pyramimonas_sp.AAC.1
MHWVITRLDDGSTIDTVHTVRYHCAQILKTCPRASRPRPLAVPAHDKRRRRGWQDGQNIPCA